MSDEHPPLPEDARTPAERAGATPLDPEKFRARSEPPAAAVKRKATELSDDDALIVRRRRRRRSGSSRTVLVIAAVLSALAVVAGLLAVVADDDTTIAVGAPPSLVAATPVLSARRAPDWLARPVAARNLQNAVAPLLAEAPENTCLQVRDTSTPVDSHNNLLPVVPASNLKLLTASSALDTLGADTRLNTRFVTDGAPTDGATVRGNLYMVGGGDPALTTDTYDQLATHGVPPGTDLESVADQIVATGVERITGSVVGDGSRYDDVTTIESWPDRFFTQGQVGRLSALMVNDAWTIDPITSSKDAGPTSDPSTHAAQVMSELLEARGVVIDGDASSGVAPQDASVLLEVPSLTVAELVSEMLRYSDNTTAELLVKEMGLQTSGSGSTEAGLAAMRQWVAESGLPAEGVVFVDGSGLSDDDRLTCEFLSAVLSHEGPTGTVAGGLAVPGQPGTLDDRFDDGPLADSLRAKTGTLRQATALSGWLTTTPGAQLAFALVINTTGRQISSSDLTLQEEILESMLSYPQRPSREALAPLAPAEAPA